MLNKVKPIFQDDLKTSKSFSGYSPKVSIRSMVHSTSELTLNSFQKKFSSSYLGKPPGESLNQSIKRCASQTFPQKTSTSSNSKSSTQHEVLPKIAPMKEIEKMIANLKKENFDLKLKLYHYEDLIRKDFDLYQLQEKNNKLKLELEEKSKQIESLKKKLAAIPEKPVEPKRKQTHSKFAFESSPEAFNLLPVKRQRFSETKSEPYWKRKAIQEDVLSSIVQTLEKIKIDSIPEDMGTFLTKAISDHCQSKPRRPCV